MITRHAGDAANSASPSSASTAGGEHLAVEPRQREWIVHVVD
jgi:hypothetical protein